MVMVIVMGVVVVMMVMVIMMMVMVAAQGAQVKNPLQGSVLQSSPAELGGLLCCRGHSGAQPGRRASWRSERRPKLRSSPSNSCIGGRGPVLGSPGGGSTGWGHTGLGRGPTSWLAVPGLGRGPRLVRSKQAPIGLRI